MSDPGYDDTQPPLPFASGWVHPTDPADLKPLLDLLFAQYGRERVLAALREVYARMEQEDPDAPLP